MKWEEAYLIGKQAESQSVEMRWRRRGLSLQ